MNISQFLMLIILAILFMTVMIRIDLNTSIIGNSNISVGQFYVGGILGLITLIVMAFAVTRK